MSKSLKLETKSFRKILEEQLKNEEVKKEFDKLTPEYEMIRTIIAIRQKYKISQTEFAKKVGTTQTRISKLERGELNPSLDFIKKIAQAFNMKVHITFEPNY